MRTSSMTDDGVLLNADQLLLRKVAECRDLVDLQELLSRFLSSGMSVGPDGSLTFTRARVDRIRGLVLEVYPHDHNPPHFHVRSPDFSAKFTLSDCRFISGSIDRVSCDLIEHFFTNGGKVKLIQAWVRMHPPG
jgi:hypothetical protein